MRIAIIAPPWMPVPPAAYGGIESVLDCLARGLITAEHDVLVFTTGDASCEAPTSWVQPVAVGTDALGVAFEVQQVLHGYAAAVEWEADIVHDHTLVGPLYAHRVGLPVVTTNHGPFDPPLGDLYRAITPDIPVIAISEAHAASARGMAALPVIHHGIDVAAAPFGARPGEFAVCLARMSPDKGVHVAIQVARAAAGVPLLIAAKMREAAERRYFEEQVEPLLGDGIEYLGEVAGCEKMELLAGARCLINPLAWAEPFGMVMIEALACGTPIVATPCGSVPEIVTDGVTGFVRSETEGLVDAVRRVDQLDRRACRAAAAERFSTARMVADHLALYQRVISGRRPLQVA